MCKDNGGGTTPATSNNQQSQTQTNAPWSGALPYLNQGLQGAQGLYQQGGPQYYPGQTYAGTNPALNSGIDQLNNIQSMFGPLQQTAQGAIGGAINAGHNVANDSQAIGESARTIQNDARTLGQSASPTNDPSYSYFSGVMNGSQGADNPYFNQMADTIRAKVQPQAIAQFANSGRGQSGLAGRAVGQGLGDSIGALAYDNYNQNLNRMSNAAGSLSGIYNQGFTDKLNAGSLGISAGNLGLGAGNQALAGGNLALQGAQLAPSIQNMGINAGNASLLAGTTAQGLQQGALSDAQTRWNAQQQQPYSNLQDYIRNITGQIGGTGMSSSSGSSSGTSTPAQPSFWNQLLGGGLAASSFFV